MKNILSYIILAILLLAGSTLFLGLSWTNGNNMSPQLDHGQKTFYLKYTLLEPNLQKSDIVLYDNPDYSSQFIGRIIGMPGERFWIEDGEIYFDQGYRRVKYVETYNRSESPSIVTENQDEQWHQLGPGEYLILRDNRPQTIENIKDHIVNKQDITGRLMFAF